MSKQLKAYFKSKGIDAFKNVLKTSDFRFNLNEVLDIKVLEKFGFKKSKGSDYFKTENGKKIWVKPETFLSNVKKLKNLNKKTLSTRRTLSSGGFEYKRDVNLTSGDYEVIIQRINRWIENSNPNDAFRVKFLTTSSSKKGPVYETAKSFTVEKIVDRYLVFDDIKYWAMGFIGSNEDYSVQIDRIIVDVIPENAGGCRTTKEKIERIDGSLYLNVRSNHNNCFFKCVQEELKIEKVTMEICNEIRKEYDIQRNNPIPASKAIEIFKERNHKKFSIYDFEGDRLLGDDDAEIQLRLQGGHYLRYTGADVTNKCKKCGLQYKNKHSCKHDKYEKCEECGGHHKEGICNKNKVTYFKNQIKKSKDRYVVSKINKEELNNDIIHFDIETHTKNNNGTHEIYIIGFNEKDTFKYFAGDECLEKFLKHFTTKNKSFIMNAFNGSGFDFYKLLNTAIKLNMKNNFKINNSRILTLEIENLKFFDLCRHTTGSLKSNLKDWKCNISKGDFDHNKGNKWNLMNENDKVECIKYLEKDVMGLKELFEKMNTAIHKEYGTNIFKYISTSQLTYTVGMSEMKYPVMLPSIEQDEFFRKAIYGGRTYPSKKEFTSSQRDSYLKGEIGFDDIYDFIVDADVVSLYPSAMAKFSYPTGKAFKAESYVINELNNHLKTTGKVKYIGIYKIEYKTNKNLIHSILPRRNDGLKWDLIDDQGYYTSADIENAYECGYKIKILEGYYWRKEAYIFKEYIEKLFDKKAKSEKGTPAYLLAKLFMNAFYGKLIQRPINEDTKIAKTNAEFWAFFKTHRITEFEYVGKNMYMNGVLRDESKLVKKITKPSYLGAFVLAYSRRIMLNYMKKSNPFFNNGSIKEQQDNDFFYTDTDAIQIHSRNAKHLTFGKQLGDISNDLGDGCKILNGIYIAPKLYCLEYAAKYGIKKGKTELEPILCECDKDKPCNGAIHYHFRGKGVSAKSLTKEVFEIMANGKQVELIQDFQIKRINVRRNNNQKHYDQFSLVHMENLKKCLNTTPWNGRCFDKKGDSLPHSSLMI